MTDLELIMAMLTHPAGFTVSLFEALYAYRLEDGRFAVFSAPSTGEKTGEFISGDVAEAAQYFLTLREALQLGFDFEKAT